MLNSENRVENLLITVLTPVYNRKHELANLYESLQKQSFKKFSWLIVDDGSNDDVDIMVEEWKRQNMLSITFIRQENGGKHRALNCGIQRVNTPYVFIVDSDDILTMDAIETVYNDASEYLKDNTICGLGYLRGYDEKTVIGEKYPQDRMISDFINVRFNQNVIGDKAEVWKTEDVKAVPFPEVQGENFMGEGYVWCTLAKKKQMLFVNKIIYITEYLEGGLSQSGRRLRIKCPIGGMYSARIMLDKRFNIKDRIKGALLYVTYGCFAKKNFRYLLKDSDHAGWVIVAYIPGCMLYHYWKRKFI